MATKICFKCIKEKDVTEFYKHPKMGDGYLGKCKTCTKQDTRKRENILISTPEGHEKEKERHREKYYRLSYKEKHKPSPKQKKIAIDKYRLNYPEKTAARQAINRKIKAKTCNELHHWSYNKEHYLDVIELDFKEHAKAHRYLVYDQERFMYRRSDNLELLDTKEAHLEYIKEKGILFPF